MPWYCQHIWNPFSIRNKSNCFLSMANKLGTIFALKHGCNTENQLIPVKRKNKRDLSPRRKILRESLNPAENRFEKWSCSKSRGKKRKERFSSSEPPRIRRFRKSGKIELEGFIPGKWPRKSLGSARDNRRVQTASRLCAPSKRQKALGRPPRHSFLI